MQLPIKSTSPTLRNKSQYELYEEDLNNYKSRSRSNLQQWNMISSRIMSPSANKKDGAKNVSNKAKQQGNRKDKHTDKGVEYLGDKADQAKNQADKRARKGSTNGQESRVSSDSKTTQRNAYSEKIKKQFQCINYDAKSADQLQKELKSMREMLIQLNNLVSSKLNKYQMITFTPKGMYVQSEPQKEQEIIRSKMELNQKIIQSLEKQIKEIQDRDKQLQQKDFLIQLQESSNAIMSQIRSKRREKHQQGVNVDKLDGKLIQMRDAQLDDQFKMVKVIKHNILYYFKKFNENKAIIEELNSNYNNLVSKDNAINSKYKDFIKIAQQKNMLVKANKNYVQNKKVYDKMNVDIEQAKKKIQIVKRSKQSECERLEKQIDFIKKQCMIAQTRTQQLEAINEDLSKGITENIQKHQISNKVLNKMSYKFAEALLKDTASKTAQSMLEAFMEPEQKQPPATITVKPKILSKPKLKLPIRSLNSSVQAETSSRYQTVSVDNAEQRQQKQEATKVNDKNHSKTIETVDIQQNKSRQFRIKPSLSIKKRDQNKSAMAYSTDLNSDEKVKQISRELDINYKPKRFNRIVSNRKEKDLLI